jgi:hypothetical protein
VGAVTVQQDRWLARTLYAAFGAVLCLLALGPRAGASVGVVLNESLHESLDRITGTGHTAVYFSNICPESPVKLRLCGPGEFGSVMSVYINIGEDQSYGWNIVPLSIYLYGVEDPAKRPIFGSHKVKQALEERYREKYLAEYCTTEPCRNSPKAEWREMVAATMIRSVYIFAVDSTIEQDQAIITEFNAAANKNDFNGFKRNCADFTRQVINTYFPNAVKRDVINDFGMTSPKAVARTFTRYAVNHPESNFRVMHFGQVPGTIKRSSEVRAGTEQLYRSKKWLVPMTVLAYHELPFAAGSYLLIGRFNPQHTFEKYASAQPAEELSAPTADQLAAVTPGERQGFVGDSNEWKLYRKEFDSLVAEDESALDRDDLTHFFKKLDRSGTAIADSDGSVWMEWSENGEPMRIGVSANNALALGSNPQSAYKFLLARTRAELKSPKHSRETMWDFKEDWVKLNRAAAEIGTSTAANSTSAGVSNVALKSGAAGKD